MKVVIIYSGKGGVGKTTTTANLAKIMSSEKKKIFVLDGDVNTPSMNNIFPDPDPNPYLHIESLGYETNRMIYIQQSMIRTYIRECIFKIKAFNPDYVLIDTPPSITDVHINLIESMKVSGIIMVTQPNVISKQDVMRTHLFFETKGVKTIGIVENMVEGETNMEYPWEILGKITFVPGFDFNKVYNVNKKSYKKMSDYLKNLDSVILESEKKIRTDESITVEDVIQIYGEVIGDRYMSKMEIPKFINLATWEFIRNRLENMQMYMGPVDRFLMENDTERIKRLLTAFENDDEAYFMITKAPCCEIQTLPGEIGQATLFFADSYYGVPRIKYHTAKGDIVLFPHEVMPVDRKELDLCLEDGGTISKDGRYIPAKETLAEIYNAFGSRVGLMENWEKHYEEIVA